MIDYETLLKEMGDLVVGWKDKDNLLNGDEWYGFIGGGGTFNIKSPLPYFAVTHSHKTKESVLETLFCQVKDQLWDRIERMSDGEL